MRTALAVCAALLLSACAFASERPLFDENEAVSPFADGARFIWLEDGEGDGQTVVYHRIGRAYDVAPKRGGETPLRVIFIDVPDTPEEDYVAQVRLRADEPMRAYAFLWRTEQGWRIVAAPGAFAEDSPAQALMRTLCAARPNNECHFARREDVLTFYHDAVHPIFVAGDARPEDFMDQIPADGAAPRTK